VLLSWIPLSDCSFGVPRLWWNCISYCQTSSSSVPRLFLCFVGFAFQVFNLVFAHASLLEIFDVMSLSCESTCKKVETHVKEMEVEGTVTVYFLSQEPPRTRHSTSPKYKEHKHRENAVTYLQADKTHTTSIQDQEYTFNFNYLAF
jgi:hypothetical protein